MPVAVSVLKRKWIFGGNHANVPVRVWAESGSRTLTDLYISPNLL